MANTNTIERVNVQGEYLCFLVRTSGDAVMAAICEPCPVKAECYGETGTNYKQARVKLTAPIVRNLKPAQAREIPCGAGIEIIQRQPHG